MMDYHQKTPTLYAPQTQSLWLHLQTGLFSLQVLHNPHPFYPTLFHNFLHLRNLQKDYLWSNMPELSNQIVSPLLILFTGELHVLMFLSIMSSSKHWLLMLHTLSFGLWNCQQSSHQNIIHSFSTSLHSNMQLKPSPDFPDFPLVTLTFHLHPQYVLLITKSPFPLPQFTFTTLISLLLYLTTTLTPPSLILPSLSILNTLILNFNSLSLSLFLPLLPLPLNPFLIPHHNNHLFFLKFNFLTSLTLLKPFFLPTSISTSALSNSPYRSWIINWIFKLPNSCSSRLNSETWQLHSIYLFQTWHIQLDTPPLVIPMAKFIAKLQNDSHQQGLHLSLCLLAATVGTCFCYSDSDSSDVDFDNPYFSND